MYDSNFFLEESGGEDEFIWTLGPEFRYVSNPEEGAIAVFSAMYLPTFSAYADHSDLNDVNQAGEMRLRLQTGRSQLEGFMRIQEESATDTLTSEFSQGTLLHTGVRAERQFAPHTRCHANWTTSMTDYDGQTMAGSLAHTAQMGAFWDGRERWQLGGTLRMTRSEGDSQGSREALAVLSDTRYRVGETLQLSASLGPEFSKTRWTGGEDDGIAVTGNLAASMKLRDRWTWYFSARQSSIPSPDSSNQPMDTVSLETSLTRDLGVGKLTIGATAENYRFTEPVETLTAPRESEMNHSLWLGYQRPLGSGYWNWDSNVRFSQNQGSNDWTRIEVSIGISGAF